jgi:hypothetical protein
MKDKHGTELHVGDKVIFPRSGYSHGESNAPMLTGTIASFQSHHCECAEQCGDDGQESALIEVEKFPYTGSYRKYSQDVTKVG